METKVQWAEMLCKSYQNSEVIIRLISAEDMVVPEYLSPNINIIHHPSNRPIAAHILIIQQSKLNQWTQFYYITQPPEGSFEVGEDDTFIGCSPLRNQSGQVGGYLIHAERQNQALLADINTSNLLKQALSNQD